MSTNLPTTEGAVLPEAIEAEIAEYEEQIRKYRRGEVGEVKMQKLRLQLGTYAQRQNGVQMIRIKIPGGILSADQLYCLADAAERFAGGFLHFTTREDVQLYYVKLDEVPDLLRLLAAGGITTREACGNTVRNITACYRAGISPTEPFDVTSYAHALFRFLLRNRYNQVMGRKFKIAFEGCAEDHSGLRIHDLGFSARVRQEDGRERRGFRVWLGGGLGGAPMLGHLYTEFLPAEDLFNFAAATVRLFDRYGERKSRMKARMKFLVQTMGWEKFRLALDEERARLGPIPFTDADLADVRQPVPPPDPAVALPVLDPRTERPDFQEWARDAVVEHRLRGFRGVHLRLRLGDILSNRLRGVADVVRRYSRGEARISIEQNLFLPWVRAADLPGLYQVLSAIGLGEPGAETIGDITACPGADTCRLGIASAKGLGAALTQAIETELSPYADLARRLRVKISGCPNGCAQHAMANIGFHSAALTEGGKTVPAYLLFLGGALHPEEARIGRVVGKYPARNGVKVLGRLLQLWQEERQGDEGFNLCMARLGEERVKAELEPFRTVPSFDADPQFYQDLGHEHERFSVRQGVKGECAGSTVAEAVPAIGEAREWLAQAEAYLYHEAYEPATLAAYEGAAAAARVPLYQRLVDPFTPEQVLWEFENLFVLSGLTGGAWGDVSAEFERLKAALPGEPSAQAILGRAREFVEFCATFAPEGAKTRVAAG